MRLDLRGNIPRFISITTAHRSDVSVLDELPVEAGAFYIMVSGLPVEACFASMDRGYIDFKRLHSLTQLGAFFVLRTRDNMVYRRRYSHPR